MALSLGDTRRRRQLTLTDEERSRHVHVVGASGTGKSKLLESLIRQDILAGRGLCVIDPHGTLVDSIVQWCAAVDANKHRRIHVVDLKEETWSAGFNPLELRSGQDIEARVDAMVATCAEVWGGEDLNQTPLLSTCLQLLFHALAANELTLVESVEMTSSLDPAGLRRRLTTGLENAVYDSYWRELSALSRRDFEDRFSSTRRRLLRFLGSPTLRRALGQKHGTLDVRRIMDDGEILLVNLVPRGPVSAENARLFGALLLSELRLAALARDPETARRRPFSLYVDECYQYLTGDVESMLDETRKFGLHTILAHQRLGQLRSRSPDLFNAVMAGAQTKIVFGGMSDEDAEIMAREVYRSSLNLERPKHVLDKPVVIDEVPYWLESESETEGESASWSTTESSTWTTGSGASESFSQGYSSQDEELGYSLGEGSSNSESYGGGSGSTSGGSSMSSRTRGRSQTLKPVRVTMPTAVYSLEEELHLAIVKLRELPNRAAILKRRGHLPVRFRPATVNPAVAPAELTQSFIEEARQASPYICESGLAEREIEVRTDRLHLVRVDEERPSEEPFWAE
jgi:hypothetical protein